MHNEHDMNNIFATHSEWNFINMISSFRTLYPEFQKCNWVILGGYGNLEEISSTFMNKSWSDTTWIMEKIKPEVANVGLPRKLDMCAIIWRLLKLQKCIWYDLSVCGMLRERSASFNLEEIDDQDKDVILSSQYNTTIMLSKLHML